MQYVFDHLSQPLLRRSGKEVTSKVATKKVASSVHPPKFHACVEETEEQVDKQEDVAVEKGQAPSTEPKKPLVASMEDASKQVGGVQAMEADADVAGDADVEPKEIKDTTEALHKQPQKQPYEEHKEEEKTTDLLKGADLFAGGTGRCRFKTGAGTRCKRNVGTVAWAPTLELCAQHTKQYMDIGAPGLDVHSES